MSVRFATVVTRLGGPQRRLRRKAAGCEVERRASDSEGRTDEEAVVLRGTRKTFNESEYELECMSTSRL